MDSGCPGKDQRYWRPDDICEVRCAHCGAEVEIWKDEPARLCPGCGRAVANPRLDLECEKWCKSANECRALRGKGSAG